MLGTPWNSWDPQAWCSLQGDPGPEGYLEFLAPRGAQATRGVAALCLVFRFASVLCPLFTYLTCNVDYISFLWYS